MATLMQIYQCSKCLEQFHDMDLALMHDCPLLEADTSEADPATTSALPSCASPSDGKSTDGKEGGEQPTATWACFTHKWGEEATQLLISLYKERQHNFTCNKHKNKKKVLWAEISNGLVAKGHVFTPWQCEHRWKMLLKIYSKLVQQFGNGRTECSFFSELNEMYGADTDAHPVATRSSLLINRASTVQAAPSEQSDHQLSEEVSSWLEVGDQGRKGKRHRVTCKSDVPQWIQVLKKQRLDLEMQKIETARRMHEEEMGVLSELLDILKSRLEGKSCR